MGVLLAGGAAAAEPEAPWVDARLSATVQVFEQGLVPGLPGATTRVQPAYPFTLTAFARGGLVEVPKVGGELTAELAAWGRVGPRDALLGDGDVTAAWAQYRRGPWRVRLGRQVTLPGASRYLRFDGISAGVSFGVFELDAYAGWVALPRWNRPRGAQLAGFVGDALLDPVLVEQQNRAGQVTAGARAGVNLGAKLRAALAFHEQRDAAGLAYRVISADVLSRPTDWLSVGGRFSFDAASLGVPEARLWADLLNEVAPVSLDYSFQNPALLLPKSSVLAAFGGVPWHELGGEASTRLPGGLKIGARLSGQLFEGTQLGGRGALKLTWTPGLDGRLTFLSEAGRALIPPSGFTWLRVAARWRAGQRLYTSADAALYLYDTKVRGHSSSVTGIASLEWTPKPNVRALVSGVVMSTPYAAFEAQALARLVMDLEPNSAAGDL